MKKFLIIVLMLMVSMMSYAETREDEPETLIGSKKGRNGYFFAPVTKYAEIDGENGVLMGGKLCWVMNGSFALGVAGYGWVDDYYLDDLWDGWSDRLNLGYGGLYMEAILGSRRVAHATVGLLLGAGGINGNAHGDCYGWWDSEAFFICEPEIGVEINVARFCRFGAGISYRFVTGVDGSGLKNSDISGWAGSITLKFGRF